MFRSLVLATALILTGQASTPQAERPARLEDPALASAIDAYVRSYVDAGDFGGAVLIARDGRILLRQGYGMAGLELGVSNTPETVFHVASIAKPFTAAVILRLQEHGLLSVTDRVSRFLPGYPRGDDITIHHLLTHRSGIPSYNRFPDYNEMLQRRLTLEEVVAWFKDKPLLFEPGERYNYSNSAYTLLAHLVERITGKTFEQVLDEEIVQPLELTGTDNFTEEQIVPGRAQGYVPGPASGGLINAKPYDRSAKRGSGALWSTIDDLYTFTAALDTGALLSPASRAQMLTRHFDQGYGYGWGLGTRHGRAIVSHDGQAPGYMARIIRIPEEKLTMIFAANISSGLSNVFNRDFPAIAFGQPTTAPKPRPLDAPVPTTTLDQYVGEYQFPESARGLKFRIIREDAALMAVFGAGQPQFLTPEGERQFLMRSRYDRLTFEVDASGRVTGVRYQELGYGVENFCTRIA